MNVINVKKIEENSDNSGLKLIRSCYPSAAERLKIKILFKWGLKDDDAVRTKVWIPILFFNQQFKASFEQYLVKKLFFPHHLFLFSKIIL